MALRGIKVKARPAAATLRWNLFVFGVGGLLLPFPFIKLIDWFLATSHLVS
jgi:K+-transporting ATPase ATPase B chain